MSENTTEKPFVKIPINLDRDPSLKFVHLFVLARAKSFEDSGLECRLTNSRLGAESGVSARTMERTVAYLINKGFITAEYNNEHNLRIIRTTQKGRDVLC